MRLITLIKKTENGDVHAPNELGVAYEYGEKGLQKNKEEAFHWFMQAVKQGFALAQYNVGIYYHSVQQNYEEAFKWYKKAARKGHNGAIYNLGVMYHEGLWVKKNSRVAFRYFLKAAQSGCVDAQNAMGFSYFNKWGVKQDYAKAFEWCLLAAKGGMAASQSKLGQMYEKGYGVEKNAVQSFHWFLKAARLGNADAMFAVGFYYNGFGRVKRINYQKVVQWYIKSFETDGRQETAQLIGILYEKGRPKLKPDLKEAEKWYEVAKNEKALERVRAKMTEINI